MQNFSEANDVTIQTRTYTILVNEMAGQMECKNSTTLNEMRLAADYEKQSPLFSPAASP